MTTPDLDRLAREATWRMPEPKRRREIEASARALARWARDEVVRELKENIPCNCWVINLLSDRARKRFKDEKCQRCARIAELRGED